MLSVVMSYLLVAQGHQVLTRKCTSIILCLHSKSAQKDIRMLILPLKGVEIAFGHPP